MTAFQNLRDQYLGHVVSEVADATYEATKNAFHDVFEELPAELPPPRTPPPPPPDYGQYSQSPPPPQSQAGMYPQQHYSPPYSPPYQSPQQQPVFGTPYMPPPPPPRYKIDEEKMRSMAKWKATLNLKYIETFGSFARSMLGSLAATNSMVELVERCDQNDSALTPEQLALSPTIRKAVEQRRAIERGKTKIISDEDMRSIYEELIFQEMWDQNERGELRLEDPNDFFRNYLILTAAEILESGKEVIGDKISSAYGVIKNKFLPPGK